MKRHWSSLLGLAAGALCVFSSLNSFVSVVPWIEYDFYRDATVFCAVSFASAVVWTVLTIRRRRFLQCGLGCICLLMSGFFLFANAMTFSGLSSVRDVEMDAGSFPSVCCAARTVMERTAGKCPFALTLISACRRFQFSFSAKCADGEVCFGSSGGDGDWSISHRHAEPELLPKRNIEEVFREILARDPLIVSNDDIDIEWRPQDGTWGVDCYSVREHRTAGYSISEDFSDFRKWGD